jgi:hypothetical protein
VNIHPTNQNRLDYVQDYSEKVNSLKELIRDYLAQLQVYGLSRTQNPPGESLCRFESGLRHQQFQGFGVQGFEPLFFGEDR